MKFDVAEGTGNAVLKIIFDDTLVSEDVTIDLTDELFTTPAPEVKAEGFVSDSPVEALEGNAPASPFVFTAVARGGMAEASLTVDSQTVPAFGREVNLVGASAALQQQIASSGISAVGFFKNPDKLARLDVTEFVKSLPAGTHRISLVVKTGTPVSATLLRLWFPPRPFILKLRPRMWCSEAIRLSST